MKLRLTSVFLLLGLVFAASFRAAAQSDYSFSLDKEIVQVTWNADGTESLDYVMAFSNSPGAATIDYVDMGMPNSHFDLSTVHAYVTADRVSWPLWLASPRATSTGSSVNLGNCRSPLCGARAAAASGDSLARSGRLMRGPA